MRLVSAREAVDFLSQAAPRPWVQRLLRWMAFDEGLPAYSRKGKVQPFGTVMDMIDHLFEEAGHTPGRKLDAAIHKAFAPEIAARLVGRKLLDRFDDEPFVWDESESPVQLDIGFFLFGSEIDWENGTIKADFIPGDGEMLDLFFPASPFLGSELDRPEYEFEIAGLSFEFSRIEMLMPSMALGQSAGFVTSKTERRKPRGRPPKWDWEGAMAHVIGRAQHPDGLPTGPGAQAKIEAMIADWFMRETRDTPSSSQVRQRAAKIMEMIETPEID